MKVDLAQAFEGGRKGVSIWKTENGFQVSVKNSDMGFTVVIASTLEEALYKLFGEPDDDLL